MIQLHPKTASKLVKERQNVFKNIFSEYGTGEDFQLFKEYVKNTNFYNLIDVIKQDCEIQIQPERPIYIGSTFSDVMKRLNLIQKNVRDSSYLKTEGKKQKKEISILEGCDDLILLNEDQKFSDLEIAIWEKIFNLPKKSLGSSLIYNDEKGDFSMPSLQLKYRNNGSVENINYMGKEDKYSEKLKPLFESLIKNKIPTIMSGAVIKTNNQVINGIITCGDDRFNSCLDYLQSTRNRDYQPFDP
jgi:hypothetical protein